MSEDYVNARTGEPERPTVRASASGLINLDGRHPSVRHFAPLFSWEHLPVHLQAVSRPVAELAASFCNTLQDGPELSSALRKLREAKDCAVTQAVIDASARKQEGNHTS